jgi:hypothetical protein
MYLDQFIKIHTLFNKFRKSFFAYIQNRKEVIQIRALFNKSRKSFFSYI